jgi:rRNA-processing protein FCF1
MAFDRIRGNRTTKIVVLDSSAILMLFEFSIDLEKELTRLLGSYKIIVPKTIFNEINYLAENGKGKKKAIAKPALKLVEKYELVEDSSKFGDDAVLEIAKKFNGIVFSNDKELRKKARKEKLKTICLRGKKYLTISEDFV